MNGPAFHNHSTDSDVKSFSQKLIMTRPLSVPSGRQREAGGGEQRAVVTQLLGYMRKWLLFPSFSLLHIFHRHRIEQDFLLYKGNEWSLQGSNSTACPGWELPHTVWACPGDTQSLSVLSAPRLAFPPGTGHRGAESMRPSATERGKCQGSIALCNIQCCIHATSSGWGGLFCT